MNFSEIMKRILRNKSTSINLNNQEHLELVKKVYGKYYSEKLNYDKMYRYYKGDTDALRKYLFVNSRSNSKISTNFIKKFIKEEVAYTLGNPITYESRTDNTVIIDDVKYVMGTWSKNHDADLMKYMLIFSKVYELYYLQNGVFKPKIIKPTEGYAYIDSLGRILFFMHTYKNEFGTESYIDVYTNDFIYHLDSKFNQVLKATPNIFGEVPVSIGNLSAEGVKDSLYSDLKGLQDAFETNFSDTSNEVSDFRNAYLKLIACKLEKTDLADAKEKGILQSNSKDAQIEWLIKNINDTFVQNTLDREIDLMYQIACHINHNERLQSNLSGVTLESRLIALKYKCTNQIGCHYDIVVNRLRFICKYLNVKGKNHDYLDIKARYTPNIPKDDLSTAQMLSQAPEGTISRQTGRSLFSFISNPQAEEQRVSKELESELGMMSDLDQGDGNE